MVPTVMTKILSAEKMMANKSLHEHNCLNDMADFLEGVAGRTKCQVFDAENIARFQVEAAKSYPSPKAIDFSLKA